MVIRVFFDVEASGEKLGRVVMEVSAAVPGFFALVAVFGVALRVVFGRRIRPF